MSRVWNKFRLLLVHIRGIWDDALPVHPRICIKLIKIIIVILKSFLGFLLFLNFVMYVIVAAFAWGTLNKAIDHHHVTGNEATGFMVIFALIAGVVGAGSCLSGIHHLRVWTAESLAAGASSSMTAWALTLLAMGLACKEIHLQRREPKLIILESFVIVVSGTKLLYMMVIYPEFLLVKFLSTRLQRLVMEAHLADDQPHLIAL